MMRHLLLSLFALLLATPLLAATARLKAGVFEPPHAAPEFSLQGSDGAELKLSRYRGKLVLLVFGFTHCTEVCPITLGTLVQARQALGKAGEAVQVVYVTVDPERDDTAQMKRYLAAYDASFIGATGQPAALAAVRASYGVVANKLATKGGYAVDHSSSVYLIDRAGKLRGMMPYGHGPKDYVHDLQLLLSL
ncbi:SCO family protein [Paucibacter sediminis]|uniref:SCO family protein n=1 Tax=Paucibacter sediminis TaxID=3019553 RepID=A0AA95NGR2_9BURK|nr:SCO family protein [Paucibacter sp. S2-9]WIT12692.1 SCO family protein [Paucibacter sp. S2-9]